MLWDLALLVAARYAGCQDAKSTMCPEAINCLKIHSPDDLCPSTATFTCLSNLRNTCQVDESKVTFMDLQPYVQNVCQEFKDHLSEVSSCATFDACRENIKISQIMGASPEEQEKMSGLLVSSDSYCSFLEDLLACVIKEKEAGRCSFSAEFFKYTMDTKQSLTKLCGGNANVFGQGLQEL